MPLTTLAFADLFASFTERKPRHWPWDPSAVCFFPNFPSFDLSIYISIALSVKGLSKDPSSRCGLDDAKQEDGNETPNSIGDAKKWEEKQEKRERDQHGRKGDGPRRQEQEELDRRYSNVVRDLPSHREFRGVSGVSTTSSGATRGAKGRRRSSQCPTRADENVDHQV